MGYGGIGDRPFAHGREAVWTELHEGIVVKHQTSLEVWSVLDTFR